MPQPRASSCRSLGLLLVPLLLGAALAEQDGFIVKNLATSNIVGSGYELPAQVAADRTALMDWADELDPTTVPQKLLDTWSRNSNPCLPQWAYLSCFNGRVTSVQLPNLGIAGSVPSVFVALSELEVLDLSGNNLVGSLPEGFGTTASLQRLRYLSLAENHITGSLPASWGGKGIFPSLVLLDLGENYIAGGLPNTWGDRRAFGNLVTLLMSGNQLSGPLFSKDLTSWARPGVLPTLLKLDLSSNVFDGALPAEWAQPGSFANLRVLDVSGNQLTGSLPAEWASVLGAFPKLESLLLEGNTLGDKSAPGSADIIAWAKSTGLPSLENIVLYPGNWGLCSENPLGLLEGTSPDWAVLDTFFSNYNTATVPCPLAGSW